MLYHTRKTLGFALRLSKCDKALLAFEVVHNNRRYTVGYCYTYIPGDIDWLFTKLQCEFMRESIKTRLPCPKMLVKNYFENIVIIITHDNDISK